MLCQMCEGFAKIPQSRTIVFIADNDDDKTTKKLDANEGNGLKNWGNNVFSFILPVPLDRRGNPKICIEHLYTDAEIKTEVLCSDDVTRRLYMGNEFDENGRGEEFFCKNINACGENKICIIEGSQKEKVLRYKKDSTENLALPKMDFAEAILSGKINVNFKNFVPIFERLKQIQNEIGLP